MVTDALTRQGGVEVIFKLKSSHWSHWTVKLRIDSWVKLRKPYNWSHALREDLIYSSKKKFRGRVWLKNSVTESLSECIFKNIQQGDYFLRTVNIPSFSWPFFPDFLLWSWFRPPRALSCVRSKQARSDNLKRQGDLSSKFASVSLSQS